MAVLDTISMLAGAALFGAGWSFGGASSLVKRVTHPRSGDSGTPRPECTCGHWLSSHDKEGHCHADTERAARWNPMGSPMSFEYVPCACQQYIGPRPLEELFAQATLPPMDGA
jgi:hypothetical protein